MELTDVKTDCSYFLGHIPCAPHKEHGVHCVDNGSICKFYTPVQTDILLIKLGAAGDVVRTTPLLSAVRTKYPSAHITWLTHFPDLVPKQSPERVGANRVLAYSEQSLAVLYSSHFDVLINLDKDDYACGVAAAMKTPKESFGYTLMNNKPSPVNILAEHKYLTGLFDDISKANTKSYLEEIFEICGFSFGGEEYELPAFHVRDEFRQASKGNIVGLNTGCGGRWTSRLWDTERWKQLTIALQSNGYAVILLGGPEEHEKNITLKESTGAQYFGTMSLTDFIGLMSQCDIVVSAVTMGMHLAIGLKKQLVLLNNIFNRNEFELYGRGEIVEPSRPCQCYFKPQCTNREYKCIEYITVDQVFKAVQKLSKTKGN